MPKKKKHWILKKLEYLRREIKQINFSSGTTRRRRDLIEIVEAINSSRDFAWYHNFILELSDNGAAGKITLTPKLPFCEKDGKIILEFPSFHNTHRTVFIFAETQAGVEAAKDLKKHLAAKTMAFEFPIILKEGRRLTPIDPA